MNKCIAYQLHKHSHTCKKGGRSRCRFGFPRPPLDVTEILSPLPKRIDPRLKSMAVKNFQDIEDKLNEYGRGFKEDIPFCDFLDELDMTREEYIMALRSTIKRTAVFTRRSTNAIFVNNYNRNLLEAWGANIDVQFVLDTYACAKYCAGYMMKSDGGVSRLLNTVSQEAKKGNLDVRDKLKAFSKILITGTEISAQEAVAFLLGYPNTDCSRSEKFVNTSDPDDRTVMLKSFKELEEQDQNSTDVFQKGVLDDYCRRPKELDEVCLADFATLYDYTKSLPKTINVSASTFSSEEEPDETEGISA